MPPVDSHRERRIQSHPFLLDLRRRLRLLSVPKLVAFGACFATNAEPVYESYAKSKGLIPDQSVKDALQWLWGVASGEPPSKKLGEELLKRLDGVYLGEDGCADDPDAVDAVGLVYLAVSSCIGDCADRALAVAESLIQSAYWVIEDREDQPQTADNVVATYQRYDRSPEVLQVHSRILRLLSYLERVPQLEILNLNQLRAHAADLDRPIDP